MKTIPLFGSGIALWLSLIFHGNSLPAQCPSISAILVDACGTEQNNEFIIINSGGGFAVSDLQVDYDANSNGFGAQNSDININGTPCGVQAGNPSMITGCTNIIPIGPGATVPANSYVVLQTSSLTNTTYDFSGVCGSQQCIYLIQSTCPRSIGAFTNFGTPALRTTILGTTGGCSNSYTYDRSLLVNANGAYFAPPSTYGGSGCVAPPGSFGNPPATPVISGIPPTICKTDPPINLPTTQDGYVGNWSGPGVALNKFNPSAQNGTVTLTFTPSAGQCAKVVTTTIQVIAPTIPVITGVPTPLCQTDAPVDLPVNQGGITGGWSGSGVSSNQFNPSGLSGNITLTFTPDPGQCAAVATKVVVVNVPITPVISGIPNTICALNPPINLPTSQGGVTGEWSGTGVSGNVFDPAGLSGNITLTFTPNPGQCANIATKNINVTPATIPTITGVPGSLCQTDSPINLPTTQGGITGGWSGTGVSSNTFNPSGLSGIITLTFTPNGGQCANPATKDIEVIVPVVPMISGIPASICQTAPPIALPTVQDGKTGNWSGSGVSGNQFNPAGLSGNITLTFTPNPGQCANAATTSIEVTLPVAPVISGIPNTICQTAPPIALPTVQDGKTGNWSGSGVSSNNFNPAGLNGNITLTFTPDPGQCANNATKVISVTIPVTPNITGIPASLCQLDNPINLPTNQGGVTGGWSGTGVSGNQFNPAGLSGNVTLTFTPDAGQCANTANKVITVNIPITPNITGIPASLCQLDNPITLPTTQGGVTGTWSGTGVSGNQFNPSGLSGNITLTFTPNAGQCANATTAIINVNSPTTPNISGIPNTICQLDSPIPLPTIQSGITGSWSGIGVNNNSFNPSGQNGSITLTFTPTIGQCAVSNTTNITVNIPVTPAINGIPDLFCQTDNTISLPTNQSGINGNWSGNGVNANSFNPSGLNGNITLTFTPNAGQCANANTKVITVNKPTVPVINGVPTTICQDDNPLSLSAIQGGVTGNWSGNGVNSNQFNPSGLKGNIVLTFTPDPGQCRLIATKTVAVFTTPTFTNLTKNCDLTTQTYTISFDISGGDPTTYSVNGILVGGTKYVSIPFTSGDTYTLLLDDAHACGPVTITGTVNCNCATNAGSMNLNNTPLYVCDSSAFTVIHKGDAKLDNNDGLLFVLHDNPGAGLGNILASSSTTTFPFPPGIVLGKTYYVSAVAGNKMGVNGVDFADNCLSVSQGVPVIFYAPKVTLSSGGGICANDCYTIQVQFTGFPPFQLNYLLQTGTQSIPFVLKSDTTITTFKICPKDYSITNGSLQIIPLQVIDKNCNEKDYLPAAVSLSVFPNAITNIQQQLCPGKSIVVNGTIYDASKPTGTEIFKKAGANSCDSTVQINLSYFPSSIYDLKQTLCIGGSISVNGTNYNTSHPSGTEILLKASVHGCDSIVHIDLDFKNFVTFQLNQSICPGESILVNGNTYDVTHPSGTETIVGGSALGCDSIIQVQLSTYAPAVYNLNQTLCFGGSLIVNGTNYNESNPSGTEILTNASSHGCDSIVNIALQFSNVVTYNLNPTLCPGEKVIVKGVTYDENNLDGTESFPGGSALGCDSVVQINLKYFPKSETTVAKTLCAGEILNINGTIYSEQKPTGTEILKNMGSHGCDSIIHVQLEFKQPTTSNINKFLCSGAELMVNGTLYNESHPSGIESLQGGNAFGCDSIIQVDLKFYPAIQFVLDTTLLIGQSLVINGTTYDASHLSGTEVIVGGGAHGCDSTILVQLHFDNNSPNVTVSLTSATCPGGEDGVITFLEISNSQPPYTISMNGATPIQVASLPYDVVGLQAGNYAFIVTDANGKVSTKNIILPDPPPLQLELGADLSLTEGESITLQPITNVNVLNWSWSPPDYLSCINCQNPVAIPEKDQTYSLLITDQNGCEAKDEIHIHLLKKTDIYVPNVISPNQDGINDILVVFASNNIVKIDLMQVFDRWGDLVYSATDFLPNDFKSGWDGTQDGKALHEDIYVWYIIFENSIGEKKKLTGDVMLMK